MKRAQPSNGSAIDDHETQPASPRSAKVVAISQPLEELSWIPRPKLLALRRLGIETVERLLTHFPRRHEDRTEFPRFPREESDTPICLCGEVIKTSLRRFGGWKKIFEATLQESQANALSEPLVCRWFNLHYVQKMIATGQRIVVFGKPRLRGKRICIDHPEFEVIENDEEISIHFRRIAPIYPATEGLSQRVLRGLVFRVLSELPPEPVGFETLLPPALMNGEMTHAAAMRSIHFPRSWEERDIARQHLVLSEFFAIQMLIASRRTDATIRSGEAHCGRGALLDKFLSSLPFSLTAAQRKVIDEIRSDLAAAHPMNRLLQGDVGSGKTVVAIAAMLLATEAGYQGAFMAPTQILAEQHYDVLRRWLEPLNVRLALRTAARQEESGPLPLFARERDSARKEILGNAPVPGAGAVVSTARTFDTEPLHEKSSSSRDAATSTRDAYAPLSEGVRYSKRHLPHFDRPWAIYAITISTRRRKKLSPAARTIVLNALRHFREKRYELYAACVVLDHAHVLLQPWPKEFDAKNDPIFWSIAELMQSIKSFTAHEINELQKTSGPVWEKESFDRLIRSDRDLQEKFHYILRNPWDSGVATQNDDYPWLWTQDDEVRNSLGSAPVPGAGAVVSTARTFETAPLHEKSSSSRDATTHTRDAYAPKSEESLGQHEPHIIVGTHALLYESVSFSNLGLVIIDEQHKFGVAQRARLSMRDPAPDVLVMTATPIPRTLTMTIYGDLDVSTIDEMPRNRGKIVTAVRDQSKLPEVLAFLRTQLEQGRQLYVVYPLIDESEKLDAKAAAAEYELWRERLRPFCCELLHGRIPPAEKQQTMERFRRGETNALISTTVLEVGVDVANATVMLIENAERFGLAQLHQLRGRIGRGEHKSYCILLTSAPANEVSEKLAVLERTINGFEVAEADWELRGPGDLLGTAQSGLPALKIGNLKSDTDLMHRARAAAMSIFKQDPRLELPDNQRFRRLIVEQRGNTFSHVS
ncbi:MAG TPA: DEAD/DEAH box helicase [Candidatus Udaeobacter sp.]|nr:DEAD/DEAH box helicase [Candidatus Udaeobacter sp.]